MSNALINNYTMALKQWQDGTYRGTDEPANTTASTFYVMGHSLFTYDGGDTAVPTQWTRTGEWLGEFAANESYASIGGGDFGQLSSLNTAWTTRGTAPTAAGYSYPANTSPFWTSGSFADQNFTHFYFMASNFEQNSESPTGTYLTEALTMIDRLNAESSTAEMLMYIHWPEPNLSGTVVDPANLTAGEWTTYNAYTVDQTPGGYLRWHTDWYDAIVAARPAITVRAIPVGPIIADLLENEAYMSTLTYTDMYGDGSPHGSENCYLLSGLISFIAVYGTIPDLTSYTAPVGTSQLHTAITNNLQSIANYVDTRLTYYNNNGVGVY